jgi:hypothetical protein
MDYILWLATIFPRALFRRCFGRRPQYVIKGWV